MGLSESKVKALEVIIDELFNPTKKRSSLLRLMKKMPFVKSFPEQVVERLESLGYVITLPDTFGKRVTITPEGIMILEQYRKDQISYEKLKDVIYNRYRKFCFHKIERLRKKEKLKSKHIAVLLFFLLNGSIGESKSYKARSYEDLSYLERIVRSYLSDKHVDAEDNYALKYFLVEAKRILGDVAFNKKPDYYLREETLDHVIESIRNDVKKDASFQKKWERFKNCYKENVTFLRTRGNSYYSTTWEMELDTRFLKEYLKDAKLHDYSS